MALARQARNAIVLLGIELYFDQFPSFARSGCPSPLINRVLDRLHEHRMSALDFHGLDHAIGCTTASAFTLPLKFKVRAIAGY